MRISSGSAYVANKRQGMRLWPVILVGTGFILLCCGGVYLLARVAGVPLSALTDDPVAINRTSVYVGMFSKLGMMLWSAAAAVGFFGAAVLFMAGRSPLFLLASASLSLLLSVNDALLLAGVIPGYLQISQSVVYGGYGFLTVYLLYYAKTILETDYEPLVMAFLCFAMALLVGTALTQTEVVFSGSSFRLAGTVFWLGYLSHTASKAIVGAYDR